MEFCGALNLKRAHFSSRNMLFGVIKPASNYKLIFSERPTRLKGKKKYCVISKSTTKSKRLWQRSIHLFPSIHVGPDYGANDS